MDCCAPLKLDLKRLGSKLRSGALLMIGQGDYDAYVKHRRALHPDEPVMTREDYFRARGATFRRGRRARLSLLLSGK